MLDDPPLPAVSGACPQAVTLSCEPELAGASRPQAALLLACSPLAEADRDGDGEVDTNEFLR